jgi:two-component system chemotaxis sensor kinase CheA
MELDLQKYAAIFREETQGLLERIEEALAALGREGSPDAAAEIKRCVHTIKGSAAAMDRGEVSRRSHELEEEIAQHLDRADGEPGGLAGRIYDYVDFVRDHLDEGVREREGSGERRESVRVDADRLDAMLNVAGEVVNHHVHVRELARRLESGGKEVGISLLASRLEDYDRHVAMLRTLVMDLRMVPLEQVLLRFHKFVHNYSLEVGKKAELEVEGADTELDKIIANMLIEPLTHLVRNAIDHGIEREQDRIRSGKPPRGCIRIRAWQASNQVVLEVSDDGRGLDFENLARAAGWEPGETGRDALIDWMFREGTSTARTVTEVSGRGVGMGAVKAAVDRVGGSIELTTERGRGTRFTLRLPLTLAVIKALIVSLGPHTFAVPLMAVEETMKVPLGDVFRLGSHRKAVRYRGKVIPVLNSEGVADSRGEVFLVVVTDGRRKGGLAVGRTIREEEVVIKSVQEDLDISPVVSGAAILGDGALAFLLNVQHALSEANPLEEMRAAS